MAHHQHSPEIPAEERAADGRADAIAGIVLVAIAVFTAIFWISGHAVS